MKYEIKIPKPCHEDWSKMTATEKGRFCVSCKKEVVDFTKMTDQQLVNKIKTNDNLCGRFRKKQLNKEIGMNDGTSISKVAASVAFTAMLGVSEPAVAQGKSFKIEHKITEKGKVIPIKEIHKDTLVIHGTIKDKDGALPAASIVLKGTNKGTETDFDGNFSFKFTKPISEKDTLVILYLGYKTIEIPLKSIKSPINVTLVEDENTFDEIIVVGGIKGRVIIEKKQNIFKRIGNIFKRKNKNKVRVKNND